jgi:hypothetical protein
MNEYTILRTNEEDYKRLVLCLSLYMAQGDLRIYSREELCLFL